MTDSGLDPILIKVAEAMRLRWAHISADLTFLYVSPMYGDWLQQGMPNLVGKDVRSVLSASAVQVLTPIWQRVFKGESVVFSDFLKISDRHEESYVRAAYMPAPDLASFYVFYQDLSQENQTIATLRQLHSITADASLGLDDKVQRILELGSTVFDLPLALVSHIVDTRYVVQYAHTPDGAVSPGDEFELGNTYCVHTLQADAPTAFHHAGNSRIKNHPCYQGFGLESYIGTPLIVNGKRYGTLNFSGPDIHEQRFTTNDYELIRLFAQWIGNELSRVQDQKDLARNQYLLASVSKQARIGAWEVNLKTGDMFWSDMIREIHEVDADYQPSVDTAINFYKEGYSRDKITEVIERATQTGESWSEELQIVTARGNEIWVTALGSAEMEDGVCVRLFGSFQDIDERVRNELELKQAKELAESASKSKSEFLANMSHEIRTPMNGVLGMLQTLKKRHGSPEQQRQIGIALESAQSLLALLNDILDFSKVDAGKLDLEAIPFDLPAFLNSVIGAMEPLVGAKELALSLDYSGPDGAVVLGDPSRLRQILTNLIGNAIKFTEQGGIQVHAEYQSAASGDVLRCSVVDTGIGISYAAQSQLFELFTQVDTSTTREYGGTGLGLAIVKQLCHLMGGDVWVQSQPDKGSEFSFYVRLKAADSSAIAMLSEQQDSGKTAFKRGAKLLLVEDNAINQEVAKELLADLGLQVDVANNGLEALEQLAGANEQAYDLVLMDCQMPVMDGYQATQNIRLGMGGIKHQDVPVIALTAHAMQRDKEKCLAAGMDEYLAKPIDVEQLQAVLQRHL